MIEHLGADRRRLDGTRDNDHMIHHGVALPSLLVAGFLLALGGSSAAQQQPKKPIPIPSPERGGELATKLCATCHSVTAEAAGRVKADVPTFLEIAGLEGQSVVRMTGNIMMPTHPMPDIQLTRAEIADVVAYIQTLKKSD